MENQVAKKESSVPAVQNQVRESVLRSDIIVPYVVTGQSQSKSVMEGNAKLGQILRSTSLEVLGDPSNPIEAIFLHNPKTDWVIEEKPRGSDKFVFKGTMQRNASNETLPWLYWVDLDGNEVPETTKNAIQMRRVKRLSVFALLPKDIEAAQAEKKKAQDGGVPDPSKALTPVIVSFRVHSYKAGREIATFYAQAEDMDTPIYRYSLPLSCKLEKNDKGSFYIWQIDRTKAKAVAKEHMPMVEKWAQIVGSTKLEVDNVAEAETYAEPELKNVEEVC